PEQFGQLAGQGDVGNQAATAPFESSVEATQRLIDGTAHTTSDHAEQAAGSVAPTLLATSPFATQTEWWSIGVFSAPTLHYSIAPGRSFSTGVGMSESRFGERAVSRQPAHRHGLRLQQGSGGGLIRRRGSPSHRTARVRPAPPPASAQLWMSS